MSSTPRSRTEPLPESFGAGRYRVERLLGRGGMGAVYFATDTRLNRPVAVKVPKLDDLAPELAEKALRRFQREVQAAAALAHPYVCHVYDVGDDDGVPFLAMEFIDGQPLSEQMQRPWPLRSAAELIAKVAEGIAAAHAKGIVHRDLKPANIMLDARGEPKVMDFGLAKRVDDDKLTRTGALLGTPQYMPKEQVLGESHKIGPWTDVYSLGVILYELLTARLPFDGHTVPQLLGRLLSTEAIKPRDIRPDIDLALEAICLRGIGKEIAHRYASMTEFSTALHEYLGPTGAAPPPNVATASLPLLAGERAKVKDEPPPQNTKPKPVPTVAETSAPARRAKAITDSPPAPMPITVSPFCPWCAEPFGEIESCRTEPIECRQCRNVWLISEDGTKWNQAPKRAEADTPSPAEFAPPKKLPAAHRTLARDHGPASDSRIARVVYSPTRPTQSRRTLLRRQWIGVGVAALLLVIVTTAPVIYHRGNSRNETKFTDPRSFVVAKSESTATGADCAPQTALSSTDDFNPPTPPPLDEATIKEATIKEATLSKLIAILSEGSDRDRGRAARELRRFGAQGVPTLITALKDSNEDVQWCAARALGEIGPDAKEAVPALIAALKDANDYVRRVAAYALGGIGPDAREAVPVLIAALKDANTGVRYFAANALGDIGGPEAKTAIPELERSLQGMEDESFQFMIKRAISKIGNSK